MTANRPQLLDVERVQRINQILASLPRVRRYTAKICANKSLEEDILQTALVKAIKNLHYFESGDIATWLVTIVRHVHSDYYRYNWVQNRETAWPVSLNDDIRLSHEPDDLMMSKDFPKVLQCLANIKPLHADAIVAAYYIEMPYPEIAMVMQCPVGTIKSRINRGCTIVRELLEHGQRLHSDFTRFKQATKGIALDNPYYAIAKAYEELYANL